jgi:hypothetical protein
VRTNNVRAPDAPKRGTDATIRTDQQQRGGY